MFPFKWILFHSTPLEGLLENTLQNLDILVDSDVTLCYFQDTEATLTKIFKYHHTLPLQKENAGFWTKDGLDGFGIEKNIAKRRNDLKGITLKVCMVITHNETYKHLTDRRYKHVDSITKVNYFLLEHVADFINAKLNLSFEDTWGYKVNNSDYSGMMGHLLRKEVDIGGTPLFILEERIDLLDYIAMPTATYSRFIFREPKLSYVTNVFTLPFNRQVWASTIALVTITGLVLYFIMKWEYKRKSNFCHEDQLSPNNEVSIAEVALLSYGAFCQQASNIVPTSIPGRITTIILFISLMFLYTSYAANIVALLQSSSSNIQTVKDLLDSRLGVGVDDTVYNRFYFAAYQEPIHKALYLKKVAPPGMKNQFMPLKEGIANIRKGLFAFHTETGPGYKLIEETFEESEKCGLQEIKYLEVIDPWLAIQKNSSYKQLLQMCYRKLLESGIQKREVSLIYTKRPVCISRGSSFISVSLVDCYSAIVVLAGGVVASVIIWILEVLSHKRIFIRCKAALFIKKLHLCRMLKSQLK
uniref:Ionotropic receptor 75a-like isoform X1 n=1 Tax=Diabrotica virgifera virgifera TaxID=50390 RepID=A0A6P7FKM0_DIAVI